MTPEKSIHPDPEVVEVDVVFGHDQLSFTERGFLLGRSIATPDWPYSYARVYERATGALLGVAIHRKLCDASETRSLLEEIWGCHPDELRKGVEL